MDKTVVVKNYLQAGKSVCPFAKACMLEFATVSANVHTDRAIILRCLTTFAAARGNALVLLATADKDFTATTAWARELFLELMICCSQISHPTVPITEIEDHTERTVRPILSSHKIRPYLVLHAKALMTICMAPVYPAAHPRYAPHTILVVTWSNDVVEASQGTGVVSKIRETMAKEHGHIYDANELMLPLPTAGWHEEDHVSDTIRTLERAPITTMENTKQNPCSSLTTTGEDRNQIIDLRDTLLAKGDIGTLSISDQHLFRDCDIALGLVRCKPEARGEAKIRVLRALRSHVSQDV